LFNVLTGFAEPPVWERLAPAPRTMRKEMTRLIRAEAKIAKSGRPARIIAKFNSLVDAPITEELYAASQAGVQIDLIVRGICILRPGVPGLSETISVRSVIGRFLEHTRLYVFGNGGDPVVYIGSADWMTRNMDRRVESMVRLETPLIKQRVVDLAQTSLDDNRQARILHADGSYERLYPGDHKEVSTQVEHTLEAQRHASAAAGAGYPVRDDAFRPFRSVSSR
jgi:polyphosphate kinase